MMKSPRSWLFALLALLSFVLLGSVHQRGAMRPLTAAALRLAGQTSSEVRADGAGLARRHPAVLLRANTIRR